MPIVGAMTLIRPRKHGIWQVVNVLAQDAMPMQAQDHSEKRPDQTVGQSLDRRN
jgi:hypothetical protein